VDNYIYQFLSCAQAPSDSGWWGWNGVKLIYSQDNGLTWHNRSGSTPVTWESYKDRSHDSMLFFEEPREAFSLISILQMGKNYGANRDGYMYGYGVNGNEDGFMNQLVMFRVPTSRILAPGAYEFYNGMKPNEKACWSTDIRERGIVHEFPLGWVVTPHPQECLAQSWLPSVVYNCVLNVYIMACSGVGRAPDGSWFGRPSYLGIWTSSNPWGPWAQVYEDTAWTPGDDQKARCYSPQISPKWIAADGRSFWLVWSDYQGGDNRDIQLFAEELPGGPKTHSDALRELKIDRRAMPYYSFNIQRFDFGVS
jgi:hypothetical protein